MAVDQGRAGRVEVRLELEPAGRLLTREILDDGFRAERELPIFPDSLMQGHVKYHDVTRPASTDGWSPSPRECPYQAFLTHETMARVVRGRAAERAGGDHDAFHAGDHGITPQPRR